MGTLVEPVWEFPKIRGTLFGGPYNKDPSIWGTILGSPIFGNCHIQLDRIRKLKRYDQSEAPKLQLFKLKYPKPYTLNPKP